MKDTAFLVISFGTSYANTFHKTIVGIEDELKRNFPEADFFRAFSSKMIVKKIADRDGIDVDTPARAIERIRDMGYKKVICQTSFIINGYEFELIVRELKPYLGDFESFRLGRPLLTSHQDFLTTVSILNDQIPDPSPVDAWIFMGHGSAHHANTAYPAMNYYLEHFGKPGCFIGTVEGFPDIDDIIWKLQRGTYKRVGMSPFMIVCGDHALNDMAGDGPDSWKNKLIAAGYNVNCRLEGLGEVPAIRQMFVDHAKKADELKNL